jgi:hypothetical protein
MAYIVAWLRRVESVQPEFLKVTAELKTVGLQRLDAVLSPIFADATDIAAQLVAIRTAWLTGQPLTQLLADLTAQVTARLSSVDTKLGAVDARLVANLADVAAQLLANATAVNNQLAANATGVGNQLAAQNAAVDAKLVGFGTMSTRSKATVAELFAWAADKGVTADTVGSAFAQQELAYAATLAWDWRAGFYRGPVVCTGNVTIGAPTNVRPGETRIIGLRGNDATARTVTFSSAYKGLVPSIADMTASKPYRFVVFADTATELTIDARALG